MLELHQSWEDIFGIVPNLNPLAKLDGEKHASKGTKEHHLGDSGHRLVGQCDCQVDQGLGFMMGSQREGDPRGYIT